MKIEVAARTLRHGDRTGIEAGHWVVEPASVPDRSGLVRIKVQFEGDGAIEYLSFPHDRSVSIIPASAA